MAKANVKKDEFRALLQKAMEKTEQITGVSLADYGNKAEFFDNLSKAIQKSTGARVRTSTLYKSYYLGLYRERRSIIGVSEQIADAMSQFVHNKLYKENYFIERQSTTDRNYTTSKEQSLEIILSNPEAPEYPRLNPSFPATPTIPIEIEGFGTVYVKDESKNMLTNTHKDRMAWEVYIDARQKRIEALSKNATNWRYNISLLSTGSAALAVFKRLRLHMTEFKLRVIFDSELVESTDPRLEHKRDVFKELRRLESQYSDNLELFLYPIHNGRNLSSSDILEITKNHTDDAIDLTFSDEAKSLKKRYHDWLSFEIINQSPDYCYVPFGSGDLFHNILDITVEELNRKSKSKRYFGNDEVLRKCNFFGMTTLDNFSPLDKLYSPKDVHPMSNFKPEVYHDKGLKGEIHIFNNLEYQYLDDAMRYFEKHKIDAEPSGAAGLALFLQQLDQLVSHDEKGERIKYLIINTGKLNFPKLSDD